MECYLHLSKHQCHVEAKFKYLLKMLALKQVQVDYEKYVYLGKSYLHWTQYQCHVQVKLKWFSNKKVLKQTEADYEKKVPPHSKLITSLQNQGRVVNFLIINIRC